jgi:hypothetical protein
MSGGGKAATWADNEVVAASRSPELEGRIRDLERRRVPKIARDCYRRSI